VVGKLALDSNRHALEGRWRKSGEPGGIFCSSSQRRIGRKRFCFVTIGVATRGKVVYIGLGRDDVSAFVDPYRYAN